MITAWIMLLSVVCQLSLIPAINRLSLADEKDDSVLGRIVTRFVPQQPKGQRRWISCICYWSVGRGSLTSISTCWCPIRPLTYWIGGATVVVARGILSIPATLVQWDILLSATGLTWKLIYPCHLHTDATLPWETSKSSALITFSPKSSSTKVEHYSCTTSSILCAKPVRIQIQLLQQVFKMFFFVHTDQKSLLPFISSIIYNALQQGSSCVNQELSQICYMSVWHLIHTPASCPILDCQQD